MYTEEHSMRYQPCSWAVIFRAAAFACGAATIGGVVVFTESAFHNGISASQFVAGRLIWGSSFLLALVVFLAPSQLVRSPAEHRQFIMRGILFGFTTTYLYTLALENGAVAPVISILVGTSAITGMVLQFGYRLRIIHIFILIAISGPLTALAFHAFDTGGIGFWGFVAAIASGFVYGLLPVLVKTDTSTSFDVGSVGFYLGYGAIFSVLFDLIMMSGSAADMSSAVFSSDIIWAGILCTGTGYFLFQVGVTPDRFGREIGPAWSTLLYGTEPVTAILVAAMFMGQTFSSLGMILTITFLSLAMMSGFLLNTYSPERDDQ